LLSRDSVLFCQLSSLYRMQLKGTDTFWARVRRTKSGTDVLIDIHPEAFNLRAVAESEHDGAPRYVSVKTAEAFNLRAVAESEHDGAPRYVCAVRDVLCYTRQDLWIDRGGPTAWPPRSTPHLNPLEFHLWRHLKLLSPLCMQLLLATKRCLSVALDACQTVSNCPGVFERMLRSVMRRVEACTEYHGHFEHLL
jgi:hypothetical protein